MKKFIVSFVAVSGIVLALAGCGTRTANEVESKVESTMSSAEDAMESGMDISSADDTNTSVTNNSN